MCRKVQRIPQQQPQKDGFYKMQSTSGGSHTAPLQLSLPFLWGQSGWQLHSGRYSAEKKKKRKNKETVRRTILFMGLLNLYLMEVDHVKNRVCSLQCENTKSHCLKNYFSYLKQKAQPASYLHSFFKPKLEKPQARKMKYCKIQIQKSKQPQKGQK